MKKFNAHYIAGTHWDREWYRPFQEFRWLLVEVINDLLDIMDKNPHFKYFHLDGQTCLLKDYLEIMPQNEQRLRDLIEEGRILIGPWFTMPDLFCVGEETLVRNLLLGKKISEAWGTTPMNVAYTCDMFGHPSQAPQIYKGFGLQNCVVGRGTVESTTPAFFTWQSPDGSSIFTFKLQDHMGYGAFVTPRFILEGKDISDPELRAKAAEGFRKYIQHEMGRSSSTALCLMDALDHRPPAANPEEYMRLIEETMPEVATVNSTLPAFFEEASALAADLPVKSVELREPTEFRNPYNWLIPNCTSSRMKIKLANDACENLLLRYADPLAAMCALKGDTSVYPFLELAWEYLMLNHAHDSICGSSIDEAHRDMMYRYEQCKLLGEQVVSRCIGMLTAGYAELGKEEHEFTVCYYNPGTVAGTRVIELAIDFPKNYPAKTSDGFYPQEEINSFIIEDADGKNIPFQITGVTPSYAERTRFARTTTDFGDGEGDRYFVKLMQETPAMGFTLLKVKPSRQPNRNMDTLRRGTSSAENEYIHLSVNGDGTLTITDKENGEVYKGLHVFEDTSETGHGWFHMGSVNEEKILSTGAVKKISVKEDGPLSVIFRIYYELHIPVRYHHRNMSRAAEENILRITSDVTLNKGGRSVDIKTTVKNDSEDHALNLLIPSGAGRAQSYFAHTPFDLTERDISLDRKTANWNEAEITEKPFSGLFFVKDNKRGLAFISGGGLHEGGVRDDAERTMTVVMLRSYRWNPGESKISEGLELGERVYTYSLMPVNASVGVMNMFVKQQQLSAPVIARQSGQFSSGFPKLAGDKTSNPGFLQLAKNKTVLSSMKRSEDGKTVIVRIWNPSVDTVQEEIQFSSLVTDCKETDMKEDVVREIPFEGNKIFLSVPSKRIITLAITFK